MYQEDQFSLNFGIKIRNSEVITYRKIMGKKSKRPKEKKDKKDKDGKSDKTHEIAMFGYQTAVQLWIYEGELIWSKFNAMLVANSIVIGILGIAISSNDFIVPKYYIIGLVAVGIVLCLAWYQLMKRGYDTLIYWIFSASEIESNHLNPTIKTFQRGWKFSAGEEVEFDLQDKKLTHKATKAHQALRVSTTSNFVIGIFVLLYLVVLGITLFK